VPKFYEFSLLVIGRDRICSGSTMEVEGNKPAEEFGGEEEFVDYEEEEEAVPAESTAKEEADGKPASKYG